MTNENIDIIVPGAVGIITVIGIVILASFGHDSTTLDTLAGFFGTWAFGGGIYKIIASNKASNDKDSTK